MATKNELSIQDQKNLSTYFVGALDSAINLPEGTDKQRLALNFVSLLQDKPELTEFRAEVLAPMVVRCAKDNLDVLNQEVYIYKGFNGKLTYAPSYKGLRKMAIQKSVRPIKDIYAKPIFEGDTVEEVFSDGDAKITYKSNFLKRGKWVGVLAVCVFKDNSEIYELMDMEQINAVKAKSRNSGAWKDFPIEMAKKSVIRRLCKQFTLEFSDNEQAESFRGADEFIDDPKEQASKDVTENANQQDFDTEEAIEVDATTGEVIEGQQQTMFEE